MNFNFIKPVANSTKLKATIHRTGKLGFTLETIKELQLDSTKKIKLATNGADKNDKNMYMFIVADDDNESFSVVKAGTYIYLNTTNTFEDMGLDFKKNRISFSIIAVNENNQKYYKMIKKEKERSDRKDKRQK